MNKTKKHKQKLSKKHKQKLSKKQNYLGGNINDYSEIWNNHVSKELFKNVYNYYSNINFDFLADKVERELNKGNAGGPQVRSRFPAEINSKDLAESSVRGLKVLLSIKTFENVFPFTEKTRITDDSMLTDLAWHSLMLKPHKYYLITNTIMEIIYKQINKRFYSLFNINREITKAISMINRELTKTPLMVNNDNDEEEPQNRFVTMFNGILSKSDTINPPVLVRHGTDKEIKIDVDIRDFIKKIKEDDYGLDNINIEEGHEWNMPMPLFPDQQI